MVSIFCNSQDIIMVVYLDEGRTIKGAYYTEELRRLRQDIVKKRRGKLTTGVLLLYSPDLAYSDFCLFRNLKTNLCGSNEGIIDAIDEYLGDQEEGFSLERIRKLEDCWRKCKGRLFIYLQYLKRVNTFNLTGYSTLWPSVKQKPYIHDHKCAIKHI